MFTSVDTRRDPFDPNRRGYHAVYRDNEVNHCPGCGRTHWFLGRLLAECAFCGTAMPLKEAHRRGPPPVIARRAGAYYPTLAA